MNSADKKSMWQFKTDYQNPSEPITESELVAFFAEGHLVSDTLVREVGNETWCRAFEVSVFKNHLKVKPVEKDTSKVELSKAIPKQDFRILPAFKVLGFVIAVIISGSFLSDAIEEVPSWFVIIAFGGYLLREEYKKKQK